MLTLDDVTFDGLEGTIGSGLHFDDRLYNNMTKLIIKNSIFRNLRGWCGAAMYINNVEDVSITNTVFENNSVP